MARTIDKRAVMVRLFSKYESAQEVQRHHFNTAPPPLATITTMN